jgi:hypothetical protein
MNFIGKFELRKRNKLKIKLKIPTKTDKFEFNSVVVEWLPLLLPIREALGSTIQPKDPAILKGFLGFPQFLYANPGNLN